MDRTGLDGLDGRIVATAARMTPADGAGRSSYGFGGLHVSSNSVLSGLRLVPSLPQNARHIVMDAATGPGPAPGREIFAWRGRYDLRLHECGDAWLITSVFGGRFLIDQAGTRLRALTADLPLSDGIVDVVVRRILPRLTVLHGALPIHAAALGDPAGGVLLLGQSGAGKSTMTAALAQSGWDVLSDDSSIIPDPAAPMLAPAATGVCLWQHSRDALGLDPAHCAAMSGYDGKVRYEPPGEPTACSVPLRALLFLDRSDAVPKPRAEPVSPGKALMRAVPQIIMFNPAAPPETERACLIERLAQVLRTVPAYRLVYPDDYDALPATVAAIRQLAR